MSSTFIFEFTSCLNYCGFLMSTVSSTFNFMLSWNSIFDLNFEFVFQVHVDADVGVDSDFYFNSGPNFDIEADVSVEFAF